MKKLLLIILILLGGCVDDSYTQQYPLKYTDFQKYVSICENYDGVKDFMIARYSRKIDDKCEVDCHYEKAYYINSVICNNGVEIRFKQ